MIKQIRLRNFKCFEDETADFMPFTLLAGLNGMGKSTLIQALLLLRQNYELGLLTKEEITLNGEFVQIGNCKDLLYQYFESRKIGIEIRTDKDVHAYWKWDVEETDSDYLSLADRKVPDEIFDSSLFNLGFHYLNAERVGPRVYSQVSNYNVISQNHLGIRGEFAVNYLAKFQSREIPIRQLKHPDSEGLTLYEQINAWLSEIIRPGIRINLTSNLDMNLVGLSYQFIGGSDTGNKFRPTNVGFGISYTLSVIVAVLSSKPGTLILIENPEAHLHPRGQVQVARLLAKAAANGIQVILETHSDHILNGARVAVKEGIIKKEQTNILFFTGEVIEDKFMHYVLNPRIDDNGRIDYWPDGFFDEWERQLTNLV
ncbi:DUF3696 domain-containing protein [Desulfobacterales bacterium HSG2]|nr:DUF3696 domain-containing protein [Desulfobacterales bacterium HSG2]